MISKSQAIRDALIDGLDRNLEEICTVLEKSLESIVNPKKIRDLLYHLKSAGEIALSGKGSAQRFKLIVAGDVKPTRHRQRKQTSGVIDMPALVSKHVDRPHALLLHMLTTLAALELVLQANPRAPAVIATLMAHRQAIELAQN